jgi:hypothetical protein
MTIERHPDTGAPVLLVAEGGVQNALRPSADPIADWVDLMEVVEALCPTWPAPDPPPRGWVYRL